MLFFQFKSGTHIIKGNGNEHYKVLAVRDELSWNSTNKKFA